MTSLGSVVMMVNVSSGCLAMGSFQLSHRPAMPNSLRSFRAIAQDWSFLALGV